MGRGPLTVSSQHEHLIAGRCPPRPCERSHKRRDSAPGSFQRPRRSREPHVCTVERREPHVCTVESREPHVFTVESREPHFFTMESGEPHVFIVERREPHFCTVKSREPHVFTVESREPHVFTVESREPHVFGVLVRLKRGSTPRTISIFTRNASRKLYFEQVKFTNVVPFIKLWTLLLLHTIYTQL